MLCVIIYSMHQESCETVDHCLLTGITKWFAKEILQKKPHNFILLSISEPITANLQIREFVSRITDQFGQNITFCFYFR